MVSPGMLIDRCGYTMKYINTVKKPYVKDHIESSKSYKLSFIKDQILYLFSKKVKKKLFCFINATKPSKVSQK